jgi:hypothetical protein
MEGFAGDADAADLGARRQRRTGMLFNDRGASAAFPDTAPETFGATVTQERVRAWILLFNQTAE